MEIIRRLRAFFVPISFALTGLLFIAFSIFALTKPQETFLETQARIVRIEENYDQIQEETQYRTFVDYTVDGVDYTDAELGSYSSSMHEGDVITIEYNENDPTHIQGKGAEKIPYIFLFVGIGVVAVGAVLFIRALRSM